MLNLLCGLHQPLMQWLHVINWDKVVKVYGIFTLDVVLMLQLPSVHLLLLFCFLFQLESLDEVKKVLDHLNKQISDMNSTLQRIAAPNMKALEK